MKHHKKELKKQRKMYHFLHPYAAHPKLGAKMGPYGHRYLGGDMVVYEGYSPKHYAMFEDSVTGCRNFVNMSDVKTGHRRYIVSKYRKFNI